MSKILVAIADTVFPNWEPAEKVLADLNVSLERSENPSKEAILSVARDAEALFVTYAQITAEVINGLEKCKVIGRFGVGTDNIDIEAATKAGIVVTYAPLYCLDEVSDHAMTTLLALARKIPFSNQMVHNGRWEMPAVVPIRRLKGRTLGAGDHPFPAVDHVSVVILDGRYFHHRRVGACTAVRLGHGEDGAHVRSGEGAEILFPLSVAADHFQQMHVAFVRRANVERIGAEW